MPLKTRTPLPMRTPLLTRTETRLPMPLLARTRERGVLLRRRTAARGVGVLPRLRKEVRVVLKQLPRGRLLRPPRRRGVWSCFLR